MLESAIEKRLGQLVRRLGGRSLKLSPSVKGTPDRLVLWPNGVAEFVELKKPGGVVSEAQKVQISRLRGMGFRASVLTGTEEVSEWIEERKRWLLSSGTTNA